MRKITIFLSTVISLQAVLFEPVHAKTGEPQDLGVYGEVFPIREKSLLQVIQTKLRTLQESGALEDHQKTIADTTKHKIMHPEPVAGVHKTIKPRSFVYDPSITVPYELKDHNGQVFQHKGTKVNPLDTHAFKNPFLFVDGDDSDQVAWAQKEHKQAANNYKPKIILIKGAPFDLSKKLNIPVHFDQSGALTKKFGIGQVPARVSQQDKVLLVEELILDYDTAIGPQRGIKE